MSRSRATRFLIVLIPSLLLLSAIIVVTASRARAQDDPLPPSEGAAVTQAGDIDAVAPEEGATAAQDGDASDEDVASKQDYVGDWSGEVDDGVLGSGSLDITIILTMPKHGKPKLKGTYKIVLGGRTRKGKTSPKVDTSGALKLNFAFSIRGRTCAVRATGMLINPDEVMGTYRALGCSRGTFDVTK
jgi:hypothetical protein